MGKYKIIGVYKHNGGFTLTLYRRVFFFSYRKVVAKQFLQRPSPVGYSDGEPVGGVSLALCFCEILNVPPMRTVVYCGNELGYRMRLI